MDNNLKEEHKDRLNFKKISKAILSLILIGIFSFLIMIVTFKFSSISPDIPLYPTYFESKLLMLMNIIPIFFTMLTLSIIFNRLWLGFSLTSLFFLLLSFVNNYKLIYRDESVIFTDFQLLTESFTMAKKYKISLSNNMLIILLALVLISIILKMFFKFKIDSNKIRISSLAIVLVIIGIIIKNFYFDPQIYSEIGNKKLINIWSETQQFQSKGLVYPFTYSISTSKDRVLDGYDENRAKQLLEEKVYSNIPEDQKINIIAIMLESYNDFSKFNTIELDDSVYEDFHNIVNNSYSGKLVTNVFGGGTINTEWSFLTGYNSHPKYIKQTNSFIWYLKEQGYETGAMHPNYGWFYNRRNVNNYIGFDQFDYYENKYKDIQEQPLRDEEFFDYIIRGYEDNKKTKQPYINFSVTYQNHGPYSEQKETDIEYLKRQQDDDPATYNMINNYFSGIKSTGDSLRKLTDYFQNEDEPTIVVIFGDHNPWLGDNPNGYEMMGIDIDLTKTEGFLNYYETPYLFWGNSSSERALAMEFKGEGNEISPNFLMAELFQFLGWEGNQYMSYLFDVKDAFSVNHDMYFNVNGTYTSKLDKDNKQIWKDFNSVQYYYARNFNKTKTQD